MTKPAATPGNPPQKRRWLKDIQPPPT
jgi:hypothetical protein